MTTEQILMYFQGVRPVGPGKWQALCPAHDDHDPSLSIAIGANGGTLLHCFPGCPPEKVVAAAGLTMGDLAAAGNGNGAATPAAKRRIVCSYDYTGAQGELLFQVVRFDPKDFRQRRPDGHGGWTWNVKDTPRVLYNLRSIIDADLDEWIIVAEGEKDCDALAAIGVVATCNPGGAGKWNKLADDSVLNGRRIAIIPDRDKAGREHAQDVAARLYGRAREVRIVELPGPGKDAADWIEAGGTAKALLELVEAAPVYRPTAAQPPAAIEPFRPFPVEVLPEPVGSFVASGARAIGCDPSYLALPMLSILAAAIGNTRRIALKRNWTEPAIAWTAIVGESGTLKTPAQKLALVPIYHMQTARLREYQAAVEAYERALAGYEVELGGWKKRAAKTDGMAGSAPDKPRPPQAVRYVVGDTTVEALAPILLANPRGVLLTRDELAGWIGSFDRYVAKGRGGDSAHWLAMFGGETLIVDRRTSGTIFVPSAAVSIAGGIQPAILDRVLAAEHRDDGLLARLLLAMPPRRTKRWTEAAIPERAQAAVADLLVRLYELEPEHDESGEPRPRVLRLTPGGKAAWVAFYNAHGREQAELTGDLSAAWSKLEGYAARLALVVHLVRWAANDPTLASADGVDEVSVTAGITLSRWFGTEARRIYAALAESEPERAQRRLVELIARKGGRMTPRDLQQSERRFRATSDVAERALQRLADSGFGTWEPAPPGPQGGRPTRIFTLSRNYTTSMNPEESEGFVDVDRLDKSAHGDEALPGCMDGERVPDDVFLGCVPETDTKPVEEFEL